MASAEERSLLFTPAVERMRRQELEATQRLHIGKSLPLGRVLWLWKRLHGLSSLRGRRSSSTCQKRARTAVLEPASPLQPRCEVHQCDETLGIAEGPRGAGFQNSKEYFGQCLIKSLAG